MAYSLALNIVEHTVYCRQLRSWQKRVSGKIYIEVYMHTCPTYDKMFAVSSSRSTLRTQERLILKKKMKRTIEVAVDNALCIGTLENMYTLTQFFSCSWVVFYESNDREKYPHASYFRQTNTCTEFSVY